MDATQESIGWETYLTAGTKALSLGRYDDAEKLFQKALMEARKELSNYGYPPAAPTGENTDALFHSRTQEESPVDVEGPGDGNSGSKAKGKTAGDNQTEAGLARISENMGELYRLQGQFKESENFFKQALDLNEKVYGGGSKQVAEGLVKLGAVYRAQGKYSSVEPLLRRALTIYESEDPDLQDPLELASMLETLADFLRAHGKYGPAEPLFQRALAKRESVLGPEHPSIGPNLFNLALLYHAEGKYNLAEPLWR